MSDAKRGEIRVIDAKFLRDAMDLAFLGQWRQVVLFRSIEP